MSDILDRLATLSPEKRRLLELRLKLNRKDEAASAPAPRPRVPGAPLPLSFAQQRLWVLDRLDPGTAAYNMPGPLRIRGALDVDALGRALDALRARHETLRTTFDEVDGEPAQIVHPPAPVPLPVDDLSGMDAAAREAEVERRVHQDANTGFDLVAGPLFRARLLRLRADEHVLLLCIHHAVCDGWSLGVMARELAALYGAFTAGAPDPLPPLPLQYADFAAWQREHLARESERMLGFWREVLADAPPALDLPTDSPRPPAESHRGAIARGWIGPALAHRVRALAQAENATAFAVLLAALRVVLARHAGEDDVVIGAPVANRTRSEVEGLIGFFVNTLPLRGAVDAAEPFRALLARERTATLAAFDHQDLPFERIVEELRIPRDLARNPVFQVSLMLQNARVEPVALAGVEIAPLPVEYDTARFDLAWDVYDEDDGGLRVEVEYATDLFLPETVARMIGHLRALLDAATADPDAPVGALPMLDAAEAERVVRAGQGEARDWPFAPVHARVAAQARRTPGAVAVEGRDGALTYAELDARADGVAAALAARGAGRGTLVGVCVERSARMVAALLGVMRAGAAYLPLDPAYPADRLAYMLEDSGAALVLVDGATAGTIPDGVGTIRIDSIPPVDGFADAEVTEEDLAYVIYTSGSTGRPKGVMVRHGGVAGFLRAMAERPGMAAADTLLAVTTIAFDISVLELFLPLAEGARVVVATREEAADPALLAARIASADATVLQATPATWAMLLGAGWAPRAGTRILSGGEALPRATADRLLDAGAELWNVYGPTETTIWSTAGRVDAGDGPLPLGQPIANTTLHVVDPALRPAPTGVPGELLIGGMGVARGYLRRPALTAERFVPDPSGAPGSRLYRTGDRVRRRADGALEFLGRMDFQVKLRGFRIELGEIEAALRAQPGVGGAVAAVREDVPGDARLVAYVVARNGDGPPSGADLRAALRARLPEYMVPSAFVHLASFPLTPNGKVDRRRLPAPEPQAPERDFAPPRTPEEETLCAVFREVLRAGPVGIDDDFFALGGHSLLATQVLSRVRRSLGVELPLRALFEAPTVRALAARLHGADAADGPLLAPAPRVHPLPLSFAQERMWFLERMAPHAGIYNMPEALDLSGPVDVPALRRALDALAARHEVLRTRYAEVDGAPVQDVLPPAPVPFGMDEGTEADVARWMADEGSAPFDLRAAPPFRARLLRIAPERHVLLLNVHHIAADGWSYGVMLRELSHLYRAACRGQDAVLPPLPVQYADYAVWQRAWLAGEVMERQLAFWRDRLGGAPALLELPYDRPRPAEQDERGAVHHFTLDAALVREARTLARRESATLFMVLLAAWDAALHRWSGSDDVVVGTPVAGRAREETEELVGLFVNSLALRTDVSGDPAFRALVGRVREATLEAYAHQDVPFEELVQALDVERSLSHAPVFQVMFGLQNVPDGALEMDGVAVRALPERQTTSRFDLMLLLEETDGGLRAQVEYATALFDADTVARMMGHFAALLAAAVASPDTAVSALPMLSADERARVVERWNETDAPFDPRACVHDLVAAQAARTPHAAAVELGDERWSYAEVDARANRIARRLRGMGVGADVRVAVCLERSIDLPVAVLAVLKAGGGYVAVDPAYPADRIAYMLEDSRAAVLLTTAEVEARLPELTTPALRLDADASAIAAESADPLLAPVDAENLAYVLYTSGSTGRPKGAAMPHRPLVSMLGWQVARFGARPAARTLQFASLSFDVSFQEIFGAWAAGGALVLIDDYARRDAEALLEHLRASSVERLYLPFAALQNLAESAEGDAARLPALREVITAGEQLRSTPQLRAFFAANPGLRLDNHYGPSETHVISAHALAEDADAWPLLPPIGAPVANTRLYVLDARMQPAPVGVPGELFAGGASLARGYLDRPSLTAEKFIPDPFGAPGTRLYRTGDRARWTADGVLEYVGRTDFQVKIRGFRVEPGEVEAVIGTHPLVREAAVAVRGEGAARRLVAWVVPVEGESARVGLSGVSADLADGRTAVNDTGPGATQPAQADFTSSQPRIDSPGAGRAGGGVSDHDARAGAAVGPLPPAPSPTGPRPENGPGSVRVGEGEGEGARDGLSGAPADPADGHRAVDATDAGAGRAGGDSADRIASLDVSPLRAHVAAHLPDYMVPSAWVVLGRMPLTPSGKVDRRALPAPSDTGVAEVAGEAPRGPVEQVIASVWRDLLGTGAVHRHDSFFALGGHSLVATRMVSRIRAALGVELPLKAVFAAPTLAGLAAQVESLRAAESGAAPPPPLVPAPRDHAPALSFAQERMWFLDRLTGGTGAYNVPVALELRGALDADALHRALEAVVARHEALRTRIREDGGEPAASIAPPSSFPLPVEETVDGPGLDARLEWEARRPFALATDIPVRAVLFRLGADHHVLGLSVHHAAVDGWSLGILLRELSDAYADAAQGREVRLPPVALQYRDFAAWQRRWFAAGAMEAQLAWWRDRLAGAPAALELPTDRPRPVSPSFRGALHAFPLAEGTAARMAAFAAEARVTPFMAGLAAFQALLARYAGQDDVVVGSPIAGRHRADTESIVGLFVNTLALRTDTSGDPSFRDLVHRVRETVLDAYAHQDLPFERLVDELKVERSMSRHPLFQVIFTMEPAAAGGLELSGVAVSERAGEHRIAKMDLILGIEQAGDALTGYLEYATDLFDAGTAERMGDHFARVLEQALADPDLPLSALDPATESERVLVAGWEREPLEDHAPRAFPLRFAARVRSAPDAPALVFGGRTMTYAELDARAGRLANRLRAMGVGVESRVGVCLARTPELVVALLAVVRTGAAYVSLEPHFPDGRIEAVLRDAGARALVASTERAASLALPEGCQAIRVDDPETADAIASASPEVPVVDPHPESLSHILYTSGSTGAPKGVMIRHGSVAALLSWLERRFPLAPGDRVLASTSIAFDVHVAEVHHALASGGTLVLVENALSLAELGPDAGVMQASMVPTAAQELLRAGALPGSLRRLNLGGEPVPADLCRALYAAGVPEVHNFYGPTEDTTYSTHAHLPRDGRVTVGRQVGGTRAYVLDAALRPVPTGVPGALYLAGEGTSRGYLARPGMTAERYVPDPFGPPGSRMYTTGDRARWLPRGEIDCLGRSDFQVKVRGYRIEPGEIEAALRAHPAVANAAVSARGDAASRRLVGWVVAESGADPHPVELAAFLRERLPEYMVPSALGIVDAFPLTTSGKVDRNALPEPDRLDEAAAFAAPETEDERALAGLWAELLGVDEVGRDDAFFDRGGHSLLAMQLLARIRTQLGAELPLRAVFEAPSLRAMAARVGESRAAAGDAPPPIVPVDRADGVPLSFAQERMWFLDRLLPGSAVYNMPFRLRLRGAIDADAMRAALSALVARHESLRTVFPTRDGRPVQVVVPPFDVRLPVDDVAALSPDERDAALREIGEREARGPFDLAAGPVIRARLVRTAPAESVLLLTLHHVVGDAWSMEIVLRELARLYGAAADGVDADLPPLPVHYPDYAAWQRSWLSGARLAKQIGWWTNAMAGAPTLELPTDRPRPATPTFRGAWVEFRVGRAGADAVERLAREEGATLFQVLLAAYAVLLSRWSGQEDVVVGSPVAGRGRPETQGMVGLFLNTLALRTDLSGDPGFREVVRRVRRETVGAFSHQDVPFERLVDELRLDRSVGRHPLFQATFSVQPAEAPLAPFGTAEASLEPGETGTAKFDLTVQLFPDADGLDGGMEYAEDLFDRATAERMAAHYAALVETMAADPDRPLSRLPGALLGEERAEVLGRWAGADHAVDARPFPVLFAEQAARTPDAPAVHVRGRATSYAALDAEANRIAHHLRARGAGAETVVGVIGERDAATLAAVLGILKAGAAFLPLDPEYPEARLRHMLDDSGARLVVAPCGVPAGFPSVADLVDLRAEADAVAARPGTAPAIDVDPDQLAYVIYTSGSTGTPKGVMVPHRGVPNLADWQRRRYGITPADRVLMFASWSFDAAVADWATPLLAGASVVVATREEMLPGPALAETLRRERVTFATLPPSTLAVTDPSDLPGLRVLASAGEALQPAVAARWMEGRTLHNAYGPTEATVGTASHRLDAADRVPPIGRPVENHRAYVLDAAGEPVPPGVPGALFVGGVGVARGYLGRAGMTAERFVPDPFSGDAGARMYATGDRVRWLSGGVLDYLGRADQQVKVRGFRIEPGEVAARMMEVPGVRDALVLVRTDRRGDAVLVGYAVAPAGTLRSADLRAHLRAVLPGYMVPGAFVVMDAFPQTPNGKVDRAALPAPAAESGSAAAPQGALEQAIAAVWRQVLQTERVGVHDNFFEIGGHSLLMAQLQDALATALGRTVTMIDLFQYPTIATLAARLEASAAETTAGSDDAPKPEPGRGRGAARREAMRRRR